MTNDVGKGGFGNCLIAKTQSNRDFSHSCIRMHCRFGTKLRLIEVVGKMKFKQIDFERSVSKKLTSSKQSLRLGWKYWKMLKIYSSVSMSPSQRFGTGTVSQSCRFCCRAQVQLQCKLQVLQFQPEKLYFDLVDSIDVGEPKSSNRFKALRKNVVLHRNQGGKYCNRISPEQKEGVGVRMEELGCLKGI